eukprot:gene8894-18411_t
MISKCHILRFCHISLKCKLSRTTRPYSIAQEPFRLKESGKVSYNSGVFAHFAEGSAICSDNGSVVHAAITSKYNPDPEDDFLPLTVDYRDRAYAHRRIPQGNMRRDRHGSDEEILVGRVIDRAIRPLFAKLYTDEVQIMVTAHALDGVRDPVVLGVNATSFALMTSRQPWRGPVGCVRIGIVDDKLKLNPTVTEMENSALDLLYAGTADRPLM